MDEEKRKTEKISVVVPCYNEESCIPIFYEKTNEVLAALPLEAEYIFVDDGSSDRSLSLMRELHEKDPRVKYVSLSRNFGKEAAMYAGLKRACGDYVALMDVDLQDPPQLLTEMYEGITAEGNDCVASRRVTRKHEPVVRSMFARMFYRVINRMTDTEIMSGARDFRLMTRQMVDAVLSLAEVDRFSKEMFSWVGFKTKWLEYENVERAEGVSKWNFKKLTHYAINGIESATVAPLKINFTFFLLFLIASVGFAVTDIAFHFSDRQVSDLFILLPILFFSVSLLFLGLYVTSRYVGKVFKLVRGRPIYIVKETEESDLKNCR